MGAEAELSTDDQQFMLDNGDAYCAQAVEYVEDVRLASFPWKGRSHIWFFDKSATPTDPNL